MAVPFQPSPPAPCEPGAFDGFALSPGIVRRLAHVSGLKIVQCRWRYGDIALRQRPFAPHVALAGRYTGLDGQVDGWYPDDHRGCLCRLVPIFGKA